VTPLDLLQDALKTAARFDPAVQAGPEAILWCDPDASFASVVPLLRAKLDRLYVLDRYDPELRSAPEFELRAVAERAQAQGGSPPILWLPGVSRDVLKSAAGCPRELEPLLWLAASGVFFGHVNGKDWSLRAFLTAERGPVRIDIADGAEAKEALALAAPHLFIRPVESLRDRRFDADALQSLCVPDLAGEMLDWIEGRLDAQRGAARFKAFAAKAQKELGFDPRKRERSHAVRAMALRERGWEEIWKRFEASAPFAFPETHKLLRVEEPPSDFFADRSGFPLSNQRNEDVLRAALLAIADLNAAAARERLLQLEAEHGCRREGVWSRNGEAPLACALLHLTKVAQAPAWPAGDAEAIARAYVDVGAAVDGAVMEALAAAPLDRDRAAVIAAIQALYSEWLDDGARRLQELVASGSAPLGTPTTADGDADAIVFVDGLRLDLAQRLVARLEALGARVTMAWRWTGFPTSTATCKPLMSPVAAELKGSDGGDLTPVTPDGKPAAHAALRKEMAARGYVFDEGASGPLWCEIGNFDEDGHAMQVRLADQVAKGIEDVAHRLLSLAQGGRRIRVVTDHGWLLMPGGLSKAPLGVGLVEPDQKRTRYARLKEGAATEYAQAPWTWNPSVRLAMAPGASSFYAAEYAHGGVSPQECIVPVIEIGPVREVRQVKVVDAHWVNLRVRLAVDGGGQLYADLRTGPDGSGESLLAQPKRLDEHGEGSLLVSDEHEGKAATVVVLDGDRIVARRDVKIGG